MLSTMPTLLREATACLHPLLINGGCSAGKTRTIWWSQSATWGLAFLNLYLCFTQRRRSCASWISGLEGASDLTRG